MSSNLCSPSKSPENKKCPSQLNSLLVSNVRIFGLKVIPLASGGSILAVILFPTFTSPFIDFINGFQFG
jgi:hypothetical protein